MSKKSWRLRWAALLLALTTAMQAAAIGLQAARCFGGEEPPPFAFEGLVGSSAMLVTLFAALWSLVSQLLIWSEPEPPSSYLA